MLCYKSTLKNKIVLTFSSHSLGSATPPTYDNCIHLFPRVDTANITNTSLPSELSFLFIRNICNVMLICNALHEKTHTPHSPIHVSPVS